MKYAHLFVTACRGEVAPGLAYVDAMVDCRICGDQTHFAAVPFRAGICSSECFDQLEGPAALESAAETALQSQAA